MALPRGFYVLGVVSAGVLGTIMWVHHSQTKERQVLRALSLALFLPASGVRVTTLHSQ